MKRQKRSETQRGFVGFVVGDVRYAVPIAGVREIVNPQPLTDLPHPPPAVAGVADHRGEVVPVIDLRKRFGLPESSGGRRIKWLLVDVHGRTVGLRVDEVTEVFGQAGAELRAAPSLGEGDEVRGISGVISHGGKLVFVLDLDRFEAITRSLADAGALDGAVGEA